MSYSHKATSRFSVASWSESALVDIDEGEGTTMGESYFPKRGFTQAQVGYTYAGDMEGFSTGGYLNAYAADDAAPVLGLEQFTGSIGGHEGSCVFRHVGSHTGSSVSVHVEVVPGLGTGGLAGLRGEAEASIEGHSDDGYELVLSYDLA